MIDLLSLCADYVLARYSLPCCNQATTKFNSTLAVNRTLRSEIDDLREEKMIFDNLYRKLANKLVAVKKEINCVIEETTHAFEQRYDVTRVHAKYDVVFDQLTKADSDACVCDH